MRKNGLIKGRKLYSTILEILLPVAVMAALVGVREANGVTDKPATHYVNNKYTMNFKIDPAMVNLYNTTQQFNAKVAFIPGTGAGKDLHDAFLQRFPYFTGSTTFFSSNKDLNTYMTGSRYGKYADTPNILAAIVIEQSGLNATNQRNWKYSIRMNASDTRFSNWPQQSVPDTLQGKSRNDLQLDVSVSAYSRYVMRGFAALQAFTENWMIALTSSGFAMTTEYSVVPFPTVAHTSDDFADLASDFLGLFFALTFLWTVSRLIQNIVSEKEHRVKEAMKMMGVSNSAIWCSWFTTYAIIFFLIAILIVIITSGSIFKFSNKGIIFFFFWLYGLSVFCFCYMISAFFTRAVVGSLIGAILFFAAYFPYYAVNGDTDSSGSKTLSCLSTPVCFALGASTAIRFESAQQGITNQNVGTTLNNFAFGTSIGMFIFDIFLYSLLGWYFERVVPSTFGVSMPWYFCCTPSWWKQSCGLDNEEEDIELPVINNNGENDEDRNNIIEPVDDELASKVRISAKKLAKSFPNDDPNAPPIQAVSNFSLDIYEGQIFALLGHNGAGKSTTINMLVGMTAPTSGDALIYGHSIRKDMPKIRQSLGVCPQHNVLFDLLTVKEHLQLFGRIKGLSGPQLDAAVSQMIADVGLTEKADAKSAVLSGGQKRKLGVGIALIGDSKVVFLDEPTSGMDPYSRRATWELLRRGKKGRVIILTTHFMDEADQLGDRIAIMAKGQVRCCGSSLFLKSRYGVGYTMTVTKTVSDEVASADHHALAAKQSKQISSLVKSHVPAGETLSDAGAEIAFRLPFEASGSFGPLFKELDRNGPAHGVASYGISVTTLEEVFLRVGRDETADEASRQAVKQQIKERKRRSVSKMNGEDGKEDRDSYRESSRDGTTSEMANTGNGSAKVAPEVVNVLGQASLLNNVSEANVSFTRHVRALLEKRWHNTKRDKKVWTWQFLYPVLIIILALGVLTRGITSSFPSVVLTTEQYNTPNYVPFNSNNQTNNPDFPIQYLTSSIIKGNNNRLPIVQQTINTQQDMSDWLLANYFSLKESKYGSYFFQNYSSNFLGMTLFVNTTSTHAVPIFYNLLSNMYLQKYSADTSASITLTLDPFPRTADQVALRSAVNAIFISIAFALIPASYAGFMVKERESHVKHQQLISGVSIYAYWIASYIWDVVNLLITGIFCVFVILIFHVDQLIGENITVVLMSILLYSLSIASLTYLIQFLFKTHTTAQNLLLLFYILTGAILVIVSVVLDIIPSTRDVNKSLKFIYRFLPNYCFGESLTNLIVRETSVAFGEPKKPWDMEIAGYPMIYMFVFSIVYFGLVFVVEKVLRTPELLSKLIRPPSVPYQEFEEDEDVVKERDRVKNNAAYERPNGERDIIQIHGLRKVYPGRLGQNPKIAVHDLWFGVSPGECFGFLGINGAGKTTTLQMLTGDVIPTKGTAYLDGLNILTHQNELRRLLGYCPQFDALIDTMTGREHLVLFCRIKGLDESIIPSYVNAMINQLGIAEYADQPAGGYSGGNKRKLSLGIALAGNPPIIFLDEPSTGMDPKSRRGLWDLISSTMAGRSVILTTHSMEECEALCQRIGIMVSGRLRCSGSAQRLKSRFGDGYQVDADVHSDAAEDAINFFKNTFRGCRLVERHGGNLKFRIPKGSYIADQSPRQSPRGELFTLGDLFQLVEKEKETLKIKEYSISETTLEQIFIQFAKQQSEERGGVAGIDDIEVNDHVDEDHPQQPLLLAPNGGAADKEPPHIVAEDNPKIRMSEKDF